MADDVVHDVHGFADRQPAYRIALEADIQRPGHTSIAQTKVSAALDDPKPRLARRRPRQAGDAALLHGEKPIAPPPRPAQRALHRSLDDSWISRPRRTFIKD